MSYSVFRTNWEVQAQRAEELTSEAGGHQVELEARLLDDSLREAALVGMQSFF